MVCAVVPEVRDGSPMGVDPMDLPHVRDISGRFNLRLKLLLPFAIHDCLHSGEHIDGRVIRPPGQSGHILGIPSSEHLLLNTTYLNFSGGHAYLSDVWDVRLRNRSFASATQSAGSMPLRDHHNRSSPYACRSRWQSLHNGTHVSSGPFIPKADGARGCT